MELTFNTVSSFVTNTNWQYYGGETTMTYFSQMVGLTVQNFLSAAVGIAVAVALVRGDRARGAARLGNFWADLIRGTSSTSSCRSPSSSPSCSSSQGVMQTSDGYRSCTRSTGVDADDRPGPVAAQEAIKELGTNGGGFFNANSAHPFENPTP